MDDSGETEEPPEAAPALNGGGGVEHGDGSKPASADILPDGRNACAANNGGEDALEHMSSTATVTVNVCKQCGAETATRAASRRHALAHNVPVSSFSIPFSYSAATLVWQALGTYAFVVPLTVSNVLWFITLTLNTLLVALYALKWRVAPEMVADEWNSSDTATFFTVPVMTCIGLLAAAPGYVTQGTVHEVFFWILWAVWLLVSLILLGDWLYGTSRSLAHVRPVYTLPVIGHFFLVIVSTEINLPQVGMYSFSVGVFFLIILYVSMFQRLPDRPVPTTSPTLFMVLGPLSLASSSWFFLRNSLHEPGGPHEKFFPLLSLAFFYSALFLLLLMFRVRGVVLLRGRVRLNMDYWATAFPTLALAHASVQWWHYIGPTVATLVIMIILIALSMSILVVMSAVTVVTFAWRLKRGMAAFWRETRPQTVNAV